jgi:hypothetical protein
MKPIPRLIIVVHTKGDPAHALQQTQLALENGAGGVFLIDHRVGFRAQQLDCFRSLQIDYQYVREHCPHAWIGLNFLDLKPEQAAMAMAGVDSPDGLWVDNCGIRDSTSYSEPYLFLRKYFLYRTWSVFASIDFKYQTPAHDLEGATRSATSMYEVTVTSGPATGEAPTVEKLRRMRKAAGEDSNIALASGVTAENIRDFMPFVDTFMVATGVSRAFHELDDAKIREMHDILRTHPRHHHASHQ